MDKLRQIIREEISRVMKEIGEDPIKLSQNMVSSNEDQVRSLKDELRYREGDARVSGLPREEKKARIEMVKLTQDRLEQAENELELSKQAELNAVEFTQMQTSVSTQQGEQGQSHDSGQSQIQPQI